MKPGAKLLIRRAEVHGRGAFTRRTPDLADVRCRDGEITEIAGHLTPVSGETVIDARHGALLPGLHDHHIHLFSLAASLQSVACGPPGVNDAAMLTESLRAPSGTGWLRGVGYHESVAGMLDRRQLDEMVATRPVRIQHRGGKMWMVNSIGAELLGLWENRDLQGVDCDDDNNPTGRLYRLDQWLRERLGHEGAPDVTSASVKLASYGVTGITDATATNSGDTWNLFARMIHDGQILQRVRLMGDDGLHAEGGMQDTRLAEGELKVLLDEANLPEIGELSRRITETHQQKRGVAIHCVTLTELVFALAALKEAGTSSLDRVEHASETTSETVQMIRDTGATVVTQPNFIRERGDQYLADIGRSKCEELYRCRTWLEAGVPLGGGTDAPYGDPDPWHAISAGVNRQTPRGEVIGEEERITPEQALDMFLSPAGRPGERARTIEVGRPADFCLLSLPWAQARQRLMSDDVRATIRSGDIIWGQTE